MIARFDCCIYYSDRLTSSITRSSRIVAHPPLSCQQCHREGPPRRLCRRHRRRYRHRSPPRQTYVVATVAETPTTTTVPSRAMRDTTPLPGARAYRIVGGRRWGLGRRRRGHARRRHHCFHRCLSCRRQRRRRRRHSFWPISSHPLPTQDVAQDHDDDRRPAFDCIPRCHCRVVIVGTTAGVHHHAAAPAVILVVVVVTSRGASSSIARVTPPAPRGA
jgi:hypothetical protein